ncbi:hypothetical protein [uncultured Sneathiella sp.]|jgi:beta-lactamase regulating signal transducer with metallopeptidase domain|uniref:hypothetical protein n=1 Tax=uncultured Sneathiella sp. TaxID=879315 RepID=UPI0030ECD978|tara:strand:+ start:17164 stop:17460 length:297 start_codon:yes stop_codon:yes gene_type:complete
MLELLQESPFALILIPPRYVLPFGILAYVILRTLTHFRKSDVWIVLGFAHISIFAWFPALALSVPYITAIFVAVTAMGVIQYQQWRAQKRDSNKGTYR